MCMGTIGFSKHATIHSSWDTASHIFHFLNLTTVTDKQDTFLFDPVLTHEVIFTLKPKLLF